LTSYRLNNDTVLTSVTSNSYHATHAGACRQQPYGVVSPNPSRCEITLTRDSREELGIISYGHFVTFFTPAKVLASAKFIPSYCLSWCLCYITLIIN